MEAQEAVITAAAIAVAPMIAFLNWLKWGLIWLLLLLWPQPMAEIRIWKLRVEPTLLQAAPSVPYRTHRHAAGALTRTARFGYWERQPGGDQFRGATGNSWP